MPRTVRNHRRFRDRHAQNSDLGWWISGTLVLTLLVALVVYGVTRPNLTTINTQPTPIAPRATPSAKLLNLMIACRTRWAHPAQINNGCWNSYTRIRERVHRPQRKHDCLTCAGAFLT